MKKRKGFINLKLLSKTYPKFKPKITEFTSKLNDN